jgi:ATP-dependent RNA helicase DHX37/DHR1
MKLSGLHVYGSKVSVAYHVVAVVSYILQDLTVVNPAWLSTLGKPSLCTFSKPVKTMGGTTIMIPKFGPEGWELPPVKVQE